MSFLPTPQSLKAIFDQSRRFAETTAKTAMTNAGSAFDTAKSYMQRSYEKGDESFTTFWHDYGRRYHIRKILEKDEVLEDEMIEAFTADLTVPFFSHNSFMMEVIDSDNPKLFAAVLKAVAGNDPNHVLRYNRWGFMGISATAEIPLLVMAIERDKPRIALWLAQQPATDIQQGGYRTDNTGMGMAAIKLPSPLQRAEGRDNMSEVVAVLAARVQELKAQEIEVLRQKVSSPESGPV